MNALVAVIACLIVLALAAGGIHFAFGEWSWVPFCLIGFFAFMAAMAKLNAV